MCDEALQKLLVWVGEVEHSIAQQNVVQEDSEQLRNQINTVKVGWPFPPSSRSSLLFNRLRNGYRFAGD